MLYSATHKVSRFPLDTINPNLQNPFLNVEESVLVMCDGHALVAIPVELEDGDLSGAVPIEAIKDAEKKNSTSINGGRVRVECTEHDQVFVYAIGGKKTFERPQVTYPDWMRVVPDQPKRVAYIGLDSHLLARMADVMSTGAKGCVCLAIDLDHLEESRNPQTGMWGNPTLAEGYTDGFHVDGLDVDIGKKAVNVEPTEGDLDNTKRVAFIMPVRVERPAAEKPRHDGDVLDQAPAPEASPQGAAEPKGAA